MEKQMSIELVTSDVETHFTANRNRSHGKHINPTRYRNRTYNSNLQSNFSTIIYLIDPELLKDKVDHGKIRTKKKRQKNLRTYKILLSHLA